MRFREEFPASKEFSPPERERSSPKDSNGLARAAYEEAIRCSQSLFERAERLDAGLLADLSACVGRLVSHLREDNQHLLALTARSTPGNYIYGHCANVAVLGLSLGVGLEWDDEKLLALGLAAMLHDIGLKHWLSLGLAERRLSAAELKQLKLHRGDTMRLVRQAQGLDLPTLRGVSEILRQARVDGPLARRAPGLSKAVHQSAQIISVCDAYEAMSHVRCWREPLTPHEAIKRVVKLPKDQYDFGIVKAFVSLMTVYPPGSFVRLDTGEIGRVIGVDSRSPMRPVVMFIVGMEGRTLRLPWYVDLRRQPLLRIDAAVDETALDIADLRLRALFAADRWWL